MLDNYVQIMSAGETSIQYLI